MVDFRVGITKSRIFLGDLRDIVGALEGAADNHAISVTIAENVDNYPYDRDSQITISASLPKKE